MSFALFFIFRPTGIKFSIGDTHKHVFFHFDSRTVHLDTIKVLLPIDAQNNCFKRLLKFTLKQLQHVSVQSPSSGSVLFELSKVTVVKIIN